jgi:hypothetical protein
VIARADSIDAAIAAAESLALTCIAEQGDDPEMLTLSVRAAGAPPAEPEKPAETPALRRDAPGRRSARGSPRRKPAKSRLSRRDGSREARS